MLRCSQSGTNTATDGRYQGGVRISYLSRKGHQDLRLKRGTVERREVVFSLDPVGPDSPACMLGVVFCRCIFCEASHASVANFDMVTLLLT